jgi:hypothetical protein
MDKSICVICDNLVPISCLHKYFPNELPLELMRQKLQPPANLQPMFWLQPPCKVLEGMLLPTRGILLHPPLLLNSPQLSICATCFESLGKFHTTSHHNSSLQTGLILE